MSAAPFDTSHLASVAAMNQLVSTGRTTLTTTTGKLMGKKSKNSDVKRNNQPNPKKMYEEMNMIRKVKAYLHRLKILEDENALHDMSIVCESGGSSGGGGAHFGSTNSVSRTQTLKKPSSPTLSTTSSNNSKFGSNSPNSLKKLMALSEPTLNRERNKKLPPVPSFNGGSVVSLGE
jgi:Rap guanine nucleotide exchange factor 2